MTPATPVAPAEAFPTPADVKPLPPTAPATPAPPAPTTQPGAPAPATPGTPAPQPISPVKPIVELPAVPATPAPAPATPGSLVPKPPTVVQPAPNVPAAPAAQPNEPNLKHPRQPQFIGGGTINGTRVSARGRATIFSTLVFQFHKNEVVNIIEEITIAAPKAGEPRKWYRVQMPEDAGVYVHGQFLSPTFNKTIVDANGLQITQQFATVQANLLNVRSNAGENFPIVCKLLQDTAVRVSGKKKGKWVEIFAPQNASVFVAAQFVTPAPLNNGVVAIPQPQAGVQPQPGGTAPAPGGATTPGVLPLPPAQPGAQPADAVVKVPITELTKPNGTSEGGVPIQRNPGSGEGVKPTEAAKPSETVETVKPAEPVKPAEEPGKPTEVAQPVKPEETVKPGEGTNPTKTVKPAEQPEKKEPAKKDSKELQKKISQARSTASKSHASNIRSLEKAVQEIQGHRAVAEEKYKDGLDLLKKAGGLHQMNLARIQAAAGEADKAIESVKKYVDSHKGEILPQATLATLQWEHDQKKEAMETFKKLREQSAPIDLEVPAFQRLDPIAEQLGFPADWRVPLTVAKDIGERPSLDSLGPFRWRPSPAPDWTLKDDKGKEHSLKQYRGKPVVVIFYLGFGCLHCAEQLKAFAPMTEEFKKAGVSLVAISTDDQKGLKQSIEDYEEKFPFPLVSNDNLDVFKAYRSFDDFEKKTLHGTFLIDEEGLVRWQDISYEPFMDPKFVLREYQRLFGKEAAK